MARTAKFKTPHAEIVTPEVPSERPVPVGPCKFLREKVSGLLHPYSEAIAARGDLVEAYDGDPRDAALQVPAPVVT